MCRLFSRTSLIQSVLGLSPVWRGPVATLEPMQQAEVTKIAKSVWGYTERGENRFGQYGVWFATPEGNDLITSSRTISVAVLPAR